MRTARINGAGEAIFKIVAVSYSGAGAWAQQIHDLTRPEQRGGFQVIDHDAWRATSFDFVLAGMAVQGHPVRIYLFAHEGIGFIGQPGTAKDVVYKNADGIVALARDDVRDLVSVVEPDLTRLKSQGQQPAYLLVAPRVETQLVKEGVTVDVDWAAMPLEVLKPAVKLVIARYQ